MYIATSIKITNHASLLAHKPADWYASAAWVTVCYDSMHGPLCAICYSSMHGPLDGTTTSAATTTTNNNNNNITATAAAAVLVQHAQVHHLTS